MICVNSFAPPKCPDNTLITKLVLSSITITAGSVFLSFRYGAINLITAPKENKQINALLFLKSSTIFSDVDSEYQIISLSPFENLDGAKIFQFGKCSFNLNPIFTPFLVIARTEIFSTVKISQIK